MQCDLVTLTQVKILSKPEWYGSKFCFQVHSDEDGVSTIYIDAYRRRWLADQIAEHQGKTIDLVVYQVPWIIRRETGITLYLMDIKES